MNYYLLLLFSINFCHHWRETLTGDSAGYESSGRPYIEWCEEAGFRKRLYASNCQAFSFVYPYPSCYCVDGIAILTIEPDRENIREIQFSKKGCFNHKIFGFNNRTITIQPHQFSEVDTIVGIQLQREHVDPGSNEDYYEDLGIQLEWKFFTLSNVTQAQREPVTTLSSVVIYNGELIDVNQEHNNGTLLCIQKNTNPDLEKQVRHYKLQSNTWMWLNATCDGGNYFDDLEILSAGSLGTIDNRRCIPRCPEYDEASNALTLAKANDPRNSRMKLKPLIGETEDTYCSPIPTKLQLLHQDLNDRILRHAIERAFYDSQYYKPDYKPAYTFKVLQLLAKVTTKFCTHANVPPSFLEKAIEYFKIAHEGRGFYFVEAYSFLNFNSISKLLRRCLNEMDSVPYFTSQGCIKSEILSVYNSPMNKSAAKIVPLSFAHKNFDYHVVLDVPWNMLDLANTVCLRAFRKSYRMYHELERGMEKLYTPELRLFWRYPNVPEYFYEHIFGPHWMTYARNLEKCVESAYMKQPKMFRLIRPQWISGQPHASYQNRGTTLVDPVCRRSRIDLPIISNNFDIYCHPQSQHNLKTTTLATIGPKVTHHHSSTANYILTDFPVGGVQPTTEKGNDNNGDTYIDFPPKTSHVTTPKIAITGDVYIDFQPIITDQKPTKKGDQSNTNKQANIPSNKDISLQKPSTHPPIGQISTTDDVYIDFLKKPPPLANGQPSKGGADFTAHKTSSQPKNGEAQNSGDVYIDFHSIRDQSIPDLTPNKNSDIRIDFKLDEAQSPKHKGPNKSNANLNLQSPGHEHSISEIADTDVLIDFPPMKSGLVAGQKSNINSHVQIQHTTYRPLTTISKVSITSNKDNNLRNLGTNLPTDADTKTSDVFIDFQEKSLHLPIDPSNNGGANVNVHKPSGQQQTDKILHTGDVYIDFQPIGEQSPNQRGQNPNKISDIRIDFRPKEEQSLANKGPNKSDTNLNLQSPASYQSINEIPNTDVFIDFQPVTNDLKTGQKPNLNNNVTIKYATNRPISATNKVPIAGDKNFNFQKPGSNSQISELPNTAVYIDFPPGKYLKPNINSNAQIDLQTNAAKQRINEASIASDKNRNTQTASLNSIRKFPKPGDVLIDFPAETSHFKTDQVRNTGGTNTNLQIPSTLRFGQTVNTSDLYIDFKPIGDHSTAVQKPNEHNNNTSNRTETKINKKPNISNKNISIQIPGNQLPNIEVPSNGDVLIDFPAENSHSTVHTVSSTSGASNYFTKHNTQPYKVETISTKDVYIDVQPKGGPSIQDQITNKTSNVRNPITPNDSQLTSSKRPITTNTNDKNANLQINNSNPSISERSNTRDVLIDFPTENSHGTGHQASNTSSSNNNFKKSYTQPSKVEKPKTQDVYIDFHPNGGPLIQDQIPNKTSNVRNPIKQTEAQSTLVIRPNTTVTHDKNANLQIPGVNPAITEWSKTGDVLIDFPTENSHLTIHQVSNKSGESNNFTKPYTQPFKVETPNTKDVYIDFQPIKGPSIEGKTPNKSTNVRNPVSQKESQSTLNKLPNTTNANDKLQIPRSNPSISERSDTDDVLIDFPTKNSHLTMPPAFKTSGANNNFTKPNSQLPKAETSYTGDVYINFQPITDHSMPIQKVSSNPPVSDVSNTDDVLIDLPTEKYHLITDQISNKSGAITNFQNLSNQKLTGETPKISDVYLDIPRLTVHPLREKSNDAKDHRTDFTPEGAQSAINKGSNTRDKFNLQTSSSNNNSPNSKMLNTDVYIDFQPVADHLLSPKSQVNPHIQIEHTTKRSGQSIHNVLITSDKSIVSQKPGTNSPNSGVPANGDVLIDFPATNVHSMIEKAPDTSGANTFQKPITQPPSGQILNTKDVYIDFQTNQSPSLPHQIPNKNSNNHNDLTKKGDQSNPNKHANIPSNNLQKPDTNQKIGQISLTGNVYIDFVQKPPHSAIDQHSKGGATVNAHKTSNQLKTGEVPNTGDVYIDFQPIINSHVEIQHTTYRPLSTISKVSITNNEDNNLQNLGTNQKTENKVPKTGNVFLDFQEKNIRLPIDSTNKGGADVNDHKPSGQQQQGEIPHAGDVYIDFQPIREQSTNQPVQNPNEISDIRIDVRPKEDQSPANKGHNKSNTNHNLQSPASYQPINEIANTDILIDFPPITGGLVTSSKSQINSHEQIKYTTEATPPINKVPITSDKKVNFPKSGGSTLPGKNLNTNVYIDFQPIEGHLEPTKNLAKKGQVHTDVTPKGAQSTVKQGAITSDKNINFHEPATHTPIGNIPKDKGDVYLTDTNVIIDFPMHDGSSKVGHGPDEEKYDKNTNEKRGEVKIGVSITKEGNTVNSVKDGSTNQNKNAKINPKLNAGSTDHGRTVHTDFPDDIAADYAPQFNLPAAIIGSRKAKGRGSTGIEVDFRENRPARMSDFDSAAATYTTNFQKYKTLSYLPKRDNILNTNANLEQADIENVLANIPKPVITNRQQTVKTQNSNHYEYTQNGQESTKLKTDQAYMQQNSRQSENSLIEALMEDYQDYDYKLQFVTAPTHYDDSLSNLKENDTLHTKPLLDFVSKNPILLPTSSRQSSRLSVASKHDSSIKNTEPWGPQKSLSNFLSANHDIKRQIQPGKKVKAVENDENVPENYNARNLQLQVKPNKQDNGDLPKSSTSLLKPTISEIDKWIKANIAPPKFSTIMKILRKSQFQCSNTQLLYTVKEDCTLFYTCLPGVLLSSADEQKQDAVLVMYKCNTATIFDATLQGCIFGNCSPQLLQGKQKESLFLNPHM